MKYSLLRLYYQAFHMNRLEYKRDMIPTSLELGAIIPASNWNKNGELHYLGKRWFLFVPNT